MLFRSRQNSIRPSFVSFFAVICCTFCCTMRNTPKHGAKQMQRLKALKVKSFRTSSPPFFPFLYSYYRHLFGGI